MTTQPDPGLQPISFAFPFRDAKGKEIVDEHVLHEWLATEGSGSFAVSSSGMWHGGIHVSANGAGRHLDLPYGVRCLANGEIIAYRMNRTALASDIAAGAGQPARTGYYSSSFTLVRHTLEYPAQNRLTFFTLYMHLQSLADYQQKRMLAPAYWARCHEVTAHAADRPRAAPHQPVATTQIGLNIRAEPNGAVLGILPRRARVRIGEKKNNGRWGKIVAIESGTLIPPEAGGFVRPGAGNGWVYLGRAQGHRLLEAVVSEAQCDQIAVPPEPIPVSAGDLIGHPGPYWQPDDPTRDHRMVHIEVFCGDDLPGFLSASASAAQQIHDFDKLPLLRIGRGVKLFAHPSVSGEGANAPETAVVQIYSQAALDALPADSKGPKDDAYGDGQSWWKVTSANSRYEDISGWVRNRQMPPNGGVTRESPHAWKDFETVSGSDAANPTIFRTVDAWLDHLLCEDKPATGDIGQLKPLACNVYRALSPMRNDAHAADEMRALKDNKWLRFRASRLIPKHRSEWASQSEYQSFFEKVLTRVASEPYHEAEIERLRNLVWWDEVHKAVKGPFPASPEVFHIHPVALVGNFINIDGVLNKIIKKIGDIISKGEGGYESYNTGTKNVPGGGVGHSYMSPPPGTVTNKTIDEIIATDALSGTNPGRLFATGKYQTVIATLRIAKTRMNLSGSEKYDAEMQERVFREYLFGGGALSRFVKKGQGTVADAQYAAAKEWASIAVPNGLTTRDGTISDGTLSYYQSVANSASLTSTNKLKETLQEIAGSGS